MQNKFTKVTSNLIQSRISKDRKRWKFLQFTRFCCSSWLTTVEETKCFLFLPLLIQMLMASSGENSFTLGLADDTTIKSCSVSCRMLVFRPVFILFIAEKDLSHTAVEADKTIIISTIGRMCLRLSGLFASNDEYTS